LTSLNDRASHPTTHPAHVICVTHSCVPHDTSYSSPTNIHFLQLVTPNHQQIFHSYSTNSRWLDASNQYRLMDWAVFYVPANTV